MAESSEIVLSAEGVTKRYGDAVALDGVSLAVAAGECVALVGESGSGKTTLLRCFNRMTEPTAGTVRVDGEDRALPMSAVRGLAFEPDRETRHLMLDELLAEFGIGHLRRTPALALSGGERRRVEIARALATQP